MYCTDINVKLLPHFIVQVQKNQNSLQPCILLVYLKQQRTDFSHAEMQEFDVWKIDTKEITAVGLRDDDTMHLRTGLKYRSRMINCNLIEGVACQLLEKMFEGSRVNSIPGILSFHIIVESKAFEGSKCREFVRDV
jgi:hypothetical protein